MGMTPYNEQEFNRLCAEFLGMKDYHLINENFEEGYAWYYPDKNGYSDIDKNPASGYYRLPKFHSDWNWIMEVVEKISNIPDGVGYVFIRDLDGIMHKKQVVVEAIWQFLNWYNEK